MFRKLLSVVLILAVLCSSGLLPSGATRAAAANELQWEWRNPLPQGNTLRGITRGGGQFVAVGSNGTILTSPDGFAWTTRASGTARELRGIAWNGNVFVVVGEAGTILAAADGVTWTSQSSGTTAPLTSITWSGTQFVAVGYGGIILTSEDGIAWTHTYVTSEPLYDVVWGGGQFIAVSTGGLTYASTDGINWEAREIGISIEWLKFVSITWGGDQFVAMDYGVIATSPDGLDWTVQYETANGGLSTVSWTGSLYVAVGRLGTEQASYRTHGYVVVSTDGQAWTEVNLPESTEELYGVASNGSTIVAVGDCGTMVTSADGVNWLSSNSGVLGWFRDIAWSGTQFVAVGSEGVIATSSDGASWETRSSGTVASLNSVNWSGTQFVAVGEFGTILTSSDGVEWVPRASGVTSELYAVVTHGGNLVAGGNNRIVISADGETWSQVAGHLFVSANGLASNGEKLMSVGNNGRILTSSDGSLWEQESSPTPYTLLDIVWDGTQFVAVGSKVIMTSPDGVTWELRHYDVDVELYGIAAKDGMLVAVGNQYGNIGYYGVTLTSKDAIVWGKTPLATHQQLEGITSGGAQFVAVGSGNAIIAAQVVSAPPATGGSIGQQPTAKLSFSVFQNERNMLHHTDQYVASAGATVTIGNTFGTTNSRGIVIVDTDTTGSVTITKEGYLSVTRSISSLSSSNRVYLEKAGGNMPIVKNVSLNGVNIRGETAHLNADSFGNIKVDIDWNANEEHLVYIQQGITVIPVSNGQTGNVALATLLSEDKDIFLYVKATNGREVKKKLNIHVDGPDVPFLPYVSFGDSVKDVSASVLPIIGDKLKLSLELPSVELNVAFKGNKGIATFGIDIAEWNYKDTNLGDGERGESEFKINTDIAKVLKESLADLKYSLATSQLKDAGKVNRRIYDQISAHSKGGDLFKRAPAEFGLSASLIVMGYFEFSIDQHGVYLNDGSLMVMLEGKAEFTGQFLIAPVPIPFYWEAYLKGALSARGTLWSREIRAEAFHPNITLEAEITIGAGGGLGVPKVLSGGLGVEGSLNPKYTIVPGTNSFTLEATVSAYVKGSFAVWKAKKTWASKPYKILPSEVGAQSSSSLMSALTDLESYELQGREYILQPSEFTANNRSMVALSANPMNRDIKTIKTNIYPESKPQLIVLPSNTKLLVWIDDDQTRNDYNRTSLMYSYFDSSMWSDPQPVDNDGTADFSPQLKDVGGVPYLVWENAKVKFDETVTMETLFENMEISVAQYDRGTNTFINKTNLSNDSYLDILPRIDGNDSEASAVWVKNTGNDIFGLNQQNSIVVSTFDGLSWSSPFPLYENLNAIDDLTVAVLNGTRLIAYTVDMDGDLDTLEDKELFINGIRITDDDVLDSKPVFADGVLYWYSGGSIKYIDDFGTYEIKELLSEAQHIPSDRFQVYKNSFGDSYIVFTRSTGMGSELSALVHDQASGRWSPVIDLTSLGASIGDFSGFVDDAGTLRIALIRGHLLEDFTEDEDPLASVDLCLLEVSPVYNLSLGNVSYRADHLVPGNDLELSLEITNSGEIAVDTVVVELEDKFSGAITTSEVVVNLLPGMTNESVVVYKVPEGISPRDLQITVTPYEKVDFDLSDNVKTLPLYYIDVALEDLYHGHSEEGTTLIYAHIVNRSLTQVSEITVKLVRDNPEGPVLETRTIPSLDPLHVDLVSFEQHLDLTEHAVFYVIIEPVENESMRGNNSDFLVLSLVVEPPPPVLLGDVNGDGFVNAADIVPINRHALGIELITDPRALQAADVNGDGFVNAADIVPINRHALGIELLE